MKTATETCKNINMTFINDYKAYVPLASCSISHIYSASRMTHLERLYFLLADLLAYLEEQTNGLREIEKSGLEWADLLGCSEEWIFKMQKRLESAGYFKIIREKDQDNQNEKNIVIPTLPDDVLENLAKTPNRLNKEYLIFIKNKHEGCKRSYLDSSKMFIKFNLRMFKILLLDSSITPLQKLIWVHFYCKSYCAYIDNEGEGSRAFKITYKEIAASFSCNEATVSKALDNLHKNGYISKNHFKIRDIEKTNRRSKKSIWGICALFPASKMEILMQLPDRQNLAPLSEDDRRLYGFTQLNGGELPTAETGYVYNSSEEQAQPSQSQAKPAESWEYYNKDHYISKSSYNKNIDRDVGKQANKKANISPPPDVIFELTTSSIEMSEGLQLAEKFFQQIRVDCAEIDKYPEKVTTADQNLSQTEHWLVTKTAYSLYQSYCQKLAEKTKTTKTGPSRANEDLLVVEKNEVMQTFKPQEQELINIWQDLPDSPVEAIEDQEFLIRKSWLVKLLPLKNQQNPMPERFDNETKPQVTILATQKAVNRHRFVGDKEEKARKFAYALKERNLAKGYAAEISKEDLAYEFIHHAANWVPTKLHCKSRAEQIDAALSFAWVSVEKGTWRCPYQWLNAQTLQRETEAAGWK